MKRGRPLRFLAVVLGGWTVARITALWPTPAPAVVIAEAGLSVSTSMKGAAAAVGFHPVVPTMSGAGATYILPRRATASFGAPLRTQRVAAVEFVHAEGGIGSIATAPPSAIIAPSSGDIPYSPRVAAPSSAVIAPSRLSGSTWLVARGGSTSDSLAFGQLGAPQAGMRLTYALDANRRVALSARVSTPIGGAGREGALGVDWQPTRLPIHLLVEQRLPLDGGAGRPAVQLIAGAQTRLPLGFALDGYAQAGAIRGRGGFADGAAHLVRPLLTGAGATLDAGAGSWGAVQRGVARLDAGPTVGLTVAVSGISMRVAVDYRVRIAGQARPGSGPALSVGTGF